MDYHSRHGSMHSILIGPVIQKESFEALVKRFSQQLLVCWRVPNPAEILDG